MDMNLSQVPGDSEGQGSLACCSPWGHRVGHDLATEQQKLVVQWLRIHLSMQVTQVSSLDQEDFT